MNSTPSRPLRRPLVAWAIALVTSAVLASALSAVPGASDGPVIPLSQKDQREIEKYLGRGVLGPAVPAPTIENPSEFLGLGDGKVKRYRVVHGRLKGEDGEARLSALPRKDPSVTKWRFENGMREVLYGRVGPGGNLRIFSSETQDQGVISRYEPAQPFMMTDFEPGQSLNKRITVTVFDLADPSKQKHSGYLDLEYKYLGAYEVNVPAGRFEASLFRWHYKGKIGPAKVEDRQYWFMAPGMGAVAMIQFTDVSAFLVYQDHSKTAGVLVEQTTGR